MDFALSFGTDEEHSSAIAALEPLVGPSEAIRLSWISRLIRGADGIWKIRVMHPEHDLRDRQIIAVYSPDDPNRLYDSPWLAAMFLGIKVVQYELAEGVTLLNSPDNPEREILRRREALRKHEEKLAQDKADAQRREEETRKQQERDRLLALQFKDQEWGELAPQAQFAFLFALALEDGKAGFDLAGELRSLAGRARKSGYYPAPRRIWWEQAT